MKTNFTITKTSTLKISCKNDKFINLFADNYKNYSKSNSNIKLLREKEDILWK